MNTNAGDASVQQGKRYISQLHHLKLFALGLCTILCTGMADLRAVLHVQPLFLCCRWNIEEAILLSFHFSVTDAFRKKQAAFSPFHCRLPWR